MAARTVTLNIVGDSSSAEQALDKTAGAADQASGKVGAAFGGLGSTLNQLTGGAFSPLTDAMETAKAGMASVGDTGDSLTSKAGAWGAGIAALGAAFIAFGDKEKEAMQVLDVAIDNTGKSHEDYADQVAVAIDKMAKYGFTAVETEQALTKLVLATKDPAVALDLLTTAAGKATVTGKGLEGGAAALVKELTKANKAAGVDGVKSMKALETATTASTRAEDQAAKAKERLADLQAKQSASNGKSVSDSIALRGATEALSKARSASAAGAKNGAEMVANAQQRLADVHALQAEKMKPTVAETLALRNAQQAVKETAAKVAETSKGVTTAQEGVTASQKKGETGADALKKKYDGLADANSNSLSGSFRALKAEVTNTASDLAQKFGPALAIAGTAAAGIDAVMNVGTATLQAWRTMRAGATAAQATANVVTASSIPITWAALGPILLIIAAAAALGIGIYLLWRNWDTVWGAMKKVVTGTFDWVKDNWPLLLAILTGPFGLAVLFITKNWDKIKESVGGVIDWVKDNWKAVLDILTGPFRLAVGFVKDHFKEIVDFLKGIPGEIADIAAGIGRGLANPIIDAINAIAGAWNSLHFSIPKVDLGPLGDFGGGDVRVPQIPKIPRFAEGGIATGLTLAVLGDNPSGREAVVPLERAGEFGFGGGGGGGGQVPVHTTIVLDGRAIARAVTPGVREELNRMALNSSTLAVS